MSVYDAEYISTIMVQVAILSKRHLNNPDLKIQDGCPSYSQL